MLGTMIKEAFEREGTKVVGAPVTVEEVSFSPFSGEVVVLGLAVAGEEGGRFPQTLRVARLRAKADPWSLAGGGLRLNDVTADGVDLFFELGAAGSNLARLRRRAGDAGGDAPALSVESLSVERARVSAFVFGRARTLTLPSFRVVSLEEGLGGAVRSLLAALAGRALGAVRRGGAGQRRRRRL